MTDELIEDVLVEMDYIFKTRERTWEILLDRFIDVLTEGIFTNSCLVAHGKPRERFQLWVNYRRAVRKVEGYKITYGKDSVSGFYEDGKTEAETDAALMKSYQNAPKKISGISCPAKRKWAKERTEAAKARLETKGEEIQTERDKLIAKQLWELEGFLRNLPGGEKKLAEFLTNKAGYEDYLRRRPNGFQKLRDSFAS